MNEIPQSPYVLFADACPEDRSGFAQVLTQTNVIPAVLIASNGDEVKASLQQAVAAGRDGSRLPILIFLDVNLPPRGARDVIRWIHGQPALRRIPVVMLTAPDQPAAMQEAANAGADTWLYKHPAPQVLSAIVRQATTASPARLSA